MADDRTEAPTHYAERSGEQDSPQSGDGARFAREAPQGSGDNPDVGGITEGPGEPGSAFESSSSGGPVAHDTGGRAHTSPSEGHPAGDGPRSDREVGGPRAEEDAEDVTGQPGAHGDIQTKGMPPHE